MNDSIKKLIEVSNVNNWVIDTFMILFSGSMYLLRHGRLYTYIIHKIIILKNYYMIIFWKFPKLFDVRKRAIFSLGTGLKYPAGKESLLRREPDVAPVTLR